MQEEPEGRVLTLDPVGRLEAGRCVVDEVVHEATPRHPAHNVVRETPHEAGCVREGTDGVLAVRQQCTLGVPRARRLEGTEAVAARLEVTDGVGAPQGVAEVGGLVARGEQPQVDLEARRVDPCVPVRLDEVARAAVGDDHLLEPGDELLARALGVASVRVARRLACVDQRHVTVGVMLRVQLVEHARRVPVALVGEEADDELGAHGLAYVRVLGVPHGTQQLPPVIVPLVDPDRETDDDEVGRLRWHGGGRHCRGPSRGRC
mmetsp:Transcript_25373/g.60325  ORF Transcript_25373/g.60325 Transcript_25373/m.60325 type:complete len:262 (+) Transcript_25373:13-798(+)